MRMVRVATFVAVAAVVALTSCSEGVVARTPSFGKKTQEAPKPTGGQQPSEAPAAAGAGAGGAGGGLPRPEKAVTPEAAQAAKQAQQERKEREALDEKLPVKHTPKPAKKKKKKGKKAKQKPVEVVDLMLDIAGTMCDKLGGLVKRKKFSVEKRCDLLKFCIEDLTGMFDAMASEMEMTQMDLVDNALQTHHFMNFQMNMKKVVKLVLAEKRPTEKHISEELNRMMSQWILNVATGQSANSGGQLGKLSREAQKNLRAIGIGLPSYGNMDDDDVEEETALIGDDYSWAEESNKLAELYEDEDEDDEDYLYEGL